MVYPGTPARRQPLFSQHARLVGLADLDWAVLVAWAEHHRLSEGLASAAQLASLQGRQAEALELYARAADAEVKALDDLDRSKVRTAGISAVSAASLYYKAADLGRSEAVAAKWLGVNVLPDFASKQLRGLLRSICSQSDNASPPNSGGPRNAHTPE